MRDLVKPTVTLFGVCLVVTLILAFTYSITKDKISERATIDSENARKAVLSSADSFKNVDGFDELKNSNEKFAAVKEAYLGMKGSSLTGYVFVTEKKGYGGPIEIIIGIDDKGSVSGVKIGNNNETPGLGSKAKDAPFNSQFDKLSPKEALKVIKGKKSKPEEIEAISGATITSTAVTNAVQSAIDMYAEISKKEGTK